MKINTKVGEKIPTNISAVDKLCNGGALIGGFVQIQTCGLSESEIICYIRQSRNVEIVGCRNFDCGFFQVFCGEDLLHVVENVLPEATMVVLLLDYMMIQIVDDYVCRQLRKFALLKGLAFVVISTNISSPLTWPDEVEGRIKINAQGQICESSLRPRLFNEKLPH